MFCVDIELPACDSVLYNIIRKIFIFFFVRQIIGDQISLDVKNLPIFKSALDILLFTRNTIL